jgi:hypothetical protein
MTVFANYTAFYRPFIDQWAAYSARATVAFGDVPCDAAFAIAQALRNRAGGVEAPYLAMLLRDCGCSQAQFLAAQGALKSVLGITPAIGKPANNWVKHPKNSLLAAGMITLVAVAPGTVRVYLTRKGADACIAKGLDQGAVNAFVQVSDAEREAIKAAREAKKLAKAQARAAKLAPHSGNPLSMRGDTVAGDATVTADTGNGAATELPIA